VFKGWSLSWKVKVKKVGGREFFERAHDVVFSGLLLALASLLLGIHM
jgi:hypothetical protein